MKTLSIEEIKQALLNSSDTNMVDKIELIQASNADLPNTIKKICKKIITSQK